MEVLATLTPTNKMLPTGGVIVPIQRLNTITIPNSTGDKPHCIAIGRKIGVKIRIAGVVSKKVPTNSKKILMMSRITILLEEIPFNRSPTAAGIFTKEITQDMMEDTPINNTIMPVMMADSA